MDIAQSIQDGARVTYNKPVMAETTETDPAKLAREDKMITLKFQINYEHWIKEEKSFKENRVKAYTMIMDQYCAKDVQVALKKQSDFETVVLNKPLVLLERIKLLVHTPEKAKYPLLTLIEAMASILNFRQGENEDLLSYLSRYKSERDVLLTLFGDSFLDGYTINTDHYKALGSSDKEAAYKKEVMNSFLVALFLRNSDQGRYGTLAFKYWEAYEGNKDKYPADVKKMQDIMTSQPKKCKKNGNGNKNGDKNNKGNDDSSKESSFAQKNKDYACFCCGNKQCPFRDCPKK